MSRITINQLPEPVKRGQVHPKDYWNDEYFKQLEPLVAALKEEVPDAKYDGKALVFMLVQLLHFQEAALGKDAMPPRSAPKLPIKLVTDPSVGGALHAIALKLYDIRRTRGLKAIEWQNPGKRNECKEVLMVLRRELERRALLQVPHIHISPTCGIEVQRLREYVRRLQGQLAERPDAPGVTHIVHPFGPKGDPDDGKEYTTVLAVKGVQARVHYWYMPDSYDAWIPLESVDNKEVVPDRAPPGGVWKVTPRWIIDSEKYNEWMNPADYTTPEQDAEMDAAEAADAKGTKRAGSSLTGQAKKARGDGALEVAPEPLEVLGPTARLRQVLQPHRAMSDNSHTVENLSHGQINNHLSAYQPPLAPTVPPPPEVTAAAAAAAAGGGAEQDQQQQQAAANGPSAAAAAAAAAAAVAAGRPPPGPPRISGMNFCVPSAAAWFKPNSVHNIEKAALPEWFNNRCPHKTLPLYRTYRDAMLSLYWEKPERDLTFAEVRQHLDGEVNGLMKIYEFLQNWGLINARDGLLQPQLPLGLGPGVSQRMPPGTAPLYQFKKPSRLEATSAAQAGGMYGQAAATAAGGDGGRLLNPVAGRKGAEEGLNPSCLTQIFCSAMPWVDCTRLRYHCTKFPDINLCPQAFAEGRFPPGVSSKDFVRIDDSKRHNSSDHWTPEETMLLLEGVELYKEDWVKIASHVGKSQSACVTHFVRLPIEDPFIEDLTNWTEVAQRQQQQQQQQPWPPLPFQDEPNPLMSTLGVLAVILGPKVSSAAAQTALQVLAEQDLTAGAVLNPDTRLAAVKAAAKQGAANGHSAAGSDAQQQQEAGDGVNGDAVMQGPAEGSRQQDGQQGSKQQQDEAAAAAAAAAAVDPQRPIDKRLLMSAVAAGLAAAATRAKQLAFAEEREIQRCMVGLVDVAAKKVDAKITLLQQLNDPPGLDRERGIAEAAHKPLRQENQTVKAQLTQRLAIKKQQDEAAAAAKQKVEALKKQQAEAAAAARQKAAAAAAAAAAAPASPAVQASQQQQQGQQTAAKLPAFGSSGQQQQQPPAGTPSTPTAATAAAAAAGVVSPGAAGQQQSQQMSQDLQPSQQQEQTPGKSTVSSGAGGDSGVLDDDDDLGELLDDVADGDMELDGLDDEEMDMP